MSELNGVAEIVHNALAAGSRAERLMGCGQNELQQVADYLGGLAAIIMELAVRPASEHLQQSETSTAQAMQSLDEAVQGLLSLGSQNAQVVEAVNAYTMAYASGCDNTAGVRQRIVDVSLCLRSLGPEVGRGAELAGARLPLFGEAQDLIQQGNAALVAFADSTGLIITESE